MTYRIEYTHTDYKNNDNVFCMFEIEYNLKQVQDKKLRNYGKWYSEISSLTCVEGLTYFLKDKSDDYKFDYKQFIRYAKEIEEIRGTLYEIYNNKPKSEEEARKFHYYIFGSMLEVILKEFCFKYKLSLNID